MAFQNGFTWLSSENGTRDPRFQKFYNEEVERVKANPELVELNQVCASIIFLFRSLL